MAHAYILELTKDEIEYLNTVIRQRTNQAQVVDRAKTLLYKTKGISNGDIAKRLDVNINNANQGLKRGRKTAQKSRECKYVANKSHQALLRCLRQ